MNWIDRRSSSSIRHESQVAVRSNGVATSRSWAHETICESLAVVADPPNLPSRDARDECMRANIIGNHRTGSHEAVGANVVAANYRGIGADGRSATHVGAEELLVP